MRLSLFKRNSHLLKVGLALFIAFQNVLLILPYDALAQEEPTVTPTEIPAVTAEPTPEVTPIDVTPTEEVVQTVEPTVEPTDVVEEEVVKEEIIEEVIEEEAPAEEITEEYTCIPDKSLEWVYDASGTSISLVGQVNECTVYNVPFSSDLSIRFTKLPEDFSLRGGLTVTEIYLTESQVGRLNAVSNVAYDFQTDMADGTFEFEVVLPMPELYSQADLEVKYAETESQLDNALPVASFVKGNDSVTFNADHFTIFIITNPTPPPTLVIGNTFDNDEGASVYTETGTWATSSCNGWDEVTQTPTGTSRYVATNTAGASATWTFTVPVTGRYQVSASWSTHTNRATAAPFSINSNDPTELVTVNQTGPDCGWSNFVDIGAVHNFTEGITYTVNLDSNSTGGYVIADAIRVTSVDEVNLKDIHFNFPLDGDVFDASYSNIDFEVYARYGNFLNNPSGEPYRVATRYADLSNPSLDTCQEVYTNPFYNEVILTVPQSDTFTYQSSWDITSIPDGDYIICALMHRGVINQQGDFVIASEGYVAENTAEVQITIDRTPAPGSLQGRKFIDHDQDGIHDPSDSEDRLNDWTINLYELDGSDWMYVDSSITGETGEVGQWRFEELELGTYFVCEENKDNWNQSGPVLGTNPVDFDGNVLYTDVTAVTNLSPNSADEGAVCWEALLDSDDDQYGWMKFGNFELGAVQGRKFFDLNGDSYHQQDLESLLNNWTVNLYQENTNSGNWDYIDTQVTGEDFEEGQYRFEGLDSGTYFVCEEMQTGWVESSPMLGMNPYDFDMSVVNDAEGVENMSGNTSSEGEVCWEFVINRSGEEYTWIKFGNYETSLIQGRKFEDHNMNGTRQGNQGESRLNGWNINLYRLDDSVWTLFDTKETGEGSQANGQYSFDRVPMGEYLVCEVLADGWVQTGPVVGSTKNGAEAVANPISDATLGSSCWYADITEPQEITGVHIGNFKPGEVSGHKWWDANHNGTWEEVEPGIAGVTIYIDTNQNGQLDGGEVFTETEDDGSYSFDNLQLGSYRVCEVMMGEYWTQTYPDNSSDCHDFDIDMSSQVIEDLDFGNFRYGYIQGRKFYDVNANGNFDIDEKNAPGDPNRLDGWNIYLYDSDWNEVESKVTGVSDNNIGNIGKGQYRFDYLYPGTYFVCEEERAEWGQTSPNSNMSDYVESDVPGMATGCFEIQLESGQEVDTKQFGNVEYGSISGLKFRDDNFNGQFDPEEDIRKHKLNGWIITLYSFREGDIIAQYETGSNEIGKGRYLFHDLLPGSYQVCEVQKEGWVQTYPGQINDAVTTIGIQNNCHYVEVLPGQDVMDVLFGNFEYGFAQGVKYLDFNGNGYHEDEEEKINKVKIDFYMEDDGDWYQVQSMETGDDSTPAGNVGKGQYRFSYLSLGHYLVCENIDELVQTGPILGTNPVNKDGEVKNDAVAVENPLEEEGNCWEFEITGSGERYKFMKFGNAETANISGYKFNDVNHNGLDDGSSEPGLAGWTIFADYNKNGNLDSNEPNDVTEADGTYFLKDVYPGEYNICELGQSGWEQTFPYFRTGKTCYERQFNSGGEYNFVDFGNFYDLFPTVTINSSPGDTTVEQAITLTAVPAGGNPNVTVVSWSDGNFAGCNGSSNSVVTPSTPGTYTCKVTVRDLDGDLATNTKTVVVNAATNPGGGNTGGGNDNGAETGVENDVQQSDSAEEKEEGKEEEGSIFGIQTCDQKTTISGHAFFDSNDNGEFDDEDEVFSGLEIEVYYFDALDEKQVVATVKTDENGFWELDVCPGEYEVELLDNEEFPDGFELPDGSVLSINVSDDEAQEDINFVLTEVQSFNWMWCIVPLLLLLLVILLFWISRRNQENKLNLK